MTPLGAALAVLALLLIALLIILVTDGRWFGKGLMRLVYDRFGPLIFRSLSEAEIWQALAAQLHLRGDEDILDAGTAAGDRPLSIAPLPAFPAPVPGVDWSPHLVPAAEARARRLTARDFSPGLQPPRFLAADLRESLPFDDESFDTIFCFGVLEALGEAREVLNEFRRLLKPGGMLVLSVYRGLATAGAALGASWYEKELRPLGFTSFEQLPLRRSHDALIVL